MKGGMITTIYRREATQMIFIVQNTDVDDMIFDSTETVPSDR